MKTQSKWMVSAPMAAIIAVMLTGAPAAAGIDDFPGQTQLEARQAAAREWSGVDDVRVSTAEYHDVERARADGFAPFGPEGTEGRTCSDRPGARGDVRYIRGIDGTLEPAEPEGLVYEVTPNGLFRLVAVEYLLPAASVENEAGNVVEWPEVLGRRLRKQDMSTLYTLRAWVWEQNPSGMFVQVNPNVSSCTAT